MFMNQPRNLRYLLRRGLRDVVAEHLVLTGSGQTSRDREHFKGLLSLVMNEDKGKNNPLGILRFDPVVEKRSLSVYDSMGD